MITNVDPDLLSSQIYESDEYKQKMKVLRIELKDKWTQIVDQESKLIAKELLRSLGTNVHQVILGGFLPILGYFKMYNGFDPLVKFFDNRFKSLIRLFKKSNVKTNV